MTVGTRFAYARAAQVAIALSLAALLGEPASAQVLRETYTARLSRADHYNSNGERLTTPAAILRQDRANFHRFGIRDQEDEGDRFFADAANRALMERYIATGRISADAASEVVNGTPIIRVDIYRMDDGRDFVNVGVLP